MAISKSTRDQLLVEARHRCTICAEKAFEIHHIIEQAEGGGDAPENLIVLCPNCLSRPPKTSATIEASKLVQCPRCRLARGFGGYFESTYLKLGVSQLVLPEYARAAQL